RICSGRRCGDNRSDFGTDADTGEFCQSRGLEAPDILKFDIQGNELEALRGATRILETNGPLLIYLEVLFERLYKNCALFSDISAFLQEKGYELYNLYELQHSPEGRLEY